MRVEILDHGYLELVETWGSDERIIEAARMSTAKGFLGWGPSCSRCDISFEDGKNDPCCTHLANNGRGPERPHDFKPGDEKLLRFLWENSHATPFEMAGLTIEVQAPIFVFREWHRHRVPFGYNELSARYTPMPDVNYVPTLDRCMIGSDGKNRQAGTIKDAAVLTEESALKWLSDLEMFYIAAEALYQSGLSIGLPKELARVVVPVGRYSRMRATGNLRGWLGFLKLRTAPQAQFEIRQYANAVGKEIAKAFPRTWELFDEGQRRA